MNTTASLLRTTPRPFGHSTAAASSALAPGARIRRALRDLRYDDRPFVERNASLSEVTLRAHGHLGARI